jgi:hypothetical protein
VRLFKASNLRFERKFEATGTPSSDLRYMCKVLLVRVIKRGPLAVLVSIAVKGSQNMLNFFAAISNVLQRRNPAHFWLPWQCWPGDQTNTDKTPGPQIFVKLVFGSGV